MLRPFQQKLEQDIYDAWDRGARNVMPVSATGSGKTVVLSKLLNDEPGASIAIAHRQELVSQISIAHARNGLRHRLIGSSLNRIVSALHISEFGCSYLNPNAKASVAGVDTLIRMDASDPYFKSIRKFVIDEAHHVLRENKWGKAAAMFPNAVGLFPTATPYRADGKGLGRHADGVVDELVLAPTMRDIIDMGYLTDYRIFAPPSDLDMSGVNVSPTTGDFNKDQVRTAVHKSHIVGDIVSHYVKIAMGKLGVTFSVDVEEATKQAAEFRAAGVPAEVVSAKTPDHLRAQILRRFKNREILQLVNVDLFGEGFDLPAIEVVSFGRPTASFPLYVQQFGRALRLMLPDEVMSYYNDLDDAGRRAEILRSNKPHAIIIDHVSNVMRHGLPDRTVEWSLDRRERRGGGRSDAIPIRVCPNPECVAAYERLHPCCPYCGHKPEPAARSSPEYVDGDLFELDAATLEKLRGEIARIDAEPLIPRGAAPEVAGAIRKRHRERQGAQGGLRNAIAWWAGLQEAQGRSESESYRRFYFKFGVDVAGAQTLGAREAQELTEKINIELTKNGIDGNVSCKLYFAKKEPQG